MSTNQPNDPGKPDRNWLVRAVDPVNNFRTIAWAAIVLYLMLCIPIAWLSYGRLNHDALSYLSLARHWIDGRPDLAVSGTWSPLFVWLLAGLQQVFGDADVAVRVAMAFSGLLFVAGSLCFFVDAGDRRIAAANALLTAFLAALFSGSFITPDLLSAGLLLLGWRCFTRWTSLSSAAVSGALLACAYLAKAVMFPVALASVLGVAALRALAMRDRSRSLGVTRGALTIAVMLLVAAPWVALLSVKYDAFTLTHASGPQWQTIGPPGALLDQPTNYEFIVPEPGRQSQFEDESIVTRAPWSPFENRAYFVHYAKHVALNIYGVHESFGVFDVLGIGLVGLLFFGAACVFHSAPDVRLHMLERWPSLALPSVLLTGAYLLNHSGEPRYHLILAPILLLGGFHLWRQAGHVLQGAAGERKAIGLATLIALFSHAGLTQRQQPSLFDGDLSLNARPIAGELRRSGYVAPVAQIGPAQLTRPAAFISFFLGTTYNGTQIIETIDQADTACARLFVVPRGTRFSALFQGSDQYLSVKDQSPGLKRLLANEPFEIYWRVAPVTARQLCRRAGTPVRH